MNQRLNSGLPRSALSFRRLQLEQLEDRSLLSISPADPIALAAVDTSAIVAPVETSYATGDLYVQFHEDPHAANPYRESEPGAWEQTKQGIRDSVSATLVKTVFTQAMERNGELPIEIWDLPEGASAADASDKLRGKRLEITLITENPPLYWLDYGVGDPSQSMMRDQSPSIVMSSSLGNPDTRPFYVAGQVVVGFKPGTNEARKATIRTEFSARVLETTNTDQMERDGVPAVELWGLPESASCVDAVAQIEKYPEVAGISINHIAYDEVDANDPLYSQYNYQWSMQGNETSPYVNGYGSQAGEAWAAGNTGSNAVYVAVLDSGFMLTHSDLAANYDLTPGHPYDFRDEDANVSCGTNDQDYHGTMVSGIIGAVGNNGQDIAGVNWNVRIIPIRAGSATLGYNDYDVIQAVNHVVALKNSGVNIVAMNASFGGYAANGNPNVLDAIKNAASAGILFVASAGDANTNNDTNHHWPSNYNTTAASYLPPVFYNSVIAVTGLNEQGGRGSCNWGPQTVHLAAPASSVCSTYPYYGAGDQHYAFGTGTSFAAPHVTGTIALFRATNPGWISAVYVRSAVINSARGMPTPGWSTLTATGGRLNIPSVLTASSIGVFDPASYNFFQKNSNRSAYADYQFGYGGSPMTEPMAGDWDNDPSHPDATTIGLYQPSPAPTRSTWYLRKSNSSGYAEIIFQFGYSQWKPFTGDWNQDGVDTPGAFDQGTMYFYMRNSNTTGDADFGFYIYNITPSGTLLPFSGDWDGNGTETVGLYDTGNGSFYLKNSNTSGSWDIRTPFGPIVGDCRPVAGDWNSDGVDTFGLHQSSTGTFFLTNSNTSSYADLLFGFGAAGAGWKPIAGDWDATADWTYPFQPLMAAGSPGDNDPGGSLSMAGLQPIVAEALSRWSAIDATIAGRLTSVTVTTADLPSGVLGGAAGTTIYIDRDAAGFGWFVDPTPDSDEEYDPNTGAATRPGIAWRMDLLTVVEHELGHVGGLSDLDSDLETLMSSTLPAGQRRTPTLEDALLASTSDWRHE